MERMMVRDTLFGSKTWFEQWMKNFGNSGSGFWSSSNNANLKIPYIKKKQKIGPFSICVAQAAANSHTPRYDIIGDIEDVHETLKRMMFDLKVDMLMFPYLSGNSKLSQRLKRTGSRFLYNFDFCEESPLIDCSMTWDTYWSSRGKSSRKDWAKNERRLMSNEGKFSCLTTWQEVKAILPEIFEIEASGWKGAQGTAIKQDLKTRLFYESMIKHWANNGQLHLFLLSQGNNIVAFQLCTLYNDILTALKTGYLDNLSGLSPGQVVLTQTIRWAFNEQRVALLDLLGPMDDTKVKRSTNSEQLSTLQVFNYSLAGLLARLRYVTAPAIKSMVLKP